MHTARRKFLQLMGAGTLTALQSNIAKALAIPANSRTGTIMNRPLHFGRPFASVRMS